MLTIIVPYNELWDEIHQEFIEIRETKLSLEHSLLSISKWESKWCKPFLSDKEKTREETIDYVRCMTLNNNVDPNVYSALTNDNINAVMDYIHAPMTATWFSEEKQTKKNSEQITSELIYYWMVALNIPYEFQKWHLNRLLTLIRVCNIKNQPPKKQSKKDILKNNAALNAARRKKLNTTG